MLIRPTWSHKTCAEACAAKKSNVSVVQGGKMGKDGFAFCSYCIFQPFTQMQMLYILTMCIIRRYILPTTIIIWTGMERIGSCTWQLWQQKNPHLLMFTLLQLQAKYCWVCTKNLYSSLDDYLTQEVSHNLESVNWSEQEYIASERIHLFDPWD